MPPILLNGTIYIMGIYYSGSPANPEQIKYTITINPTTVLVKPLKSDRFAVGKTSNGITLVTGLTINECCEYFGRPHTYTWYPSIRNGALTNENWNGQSLFALDFDDNEISVEDALARFHNMHIYPQLWYTTLSSTDSFIRFRVCMFLDQPITNIIHHENIYTSLFKIFPEADKSCSNASRFFYGGQVSTLLHFEPIPTQLFLDNLCVKLISNDKGRSRYLKKSANCNKSNLGLKRRELYSLYENNQISPGNKNLFPPIPSYTDGGIVIDFKKARKKVKILDEFLNGKWLYHPELFGLATNLAFVRGGLKLMKKTMKKFNRLGKTNYTDDNFSTIVYINNTLYYPKAIHSFSPYPEDEEYIDLISATRNIRGHIETIEEIKRIPLEEAVNIFTDKFNKAIASDNNDKISLFSLPTAIGKTQSLTILTGVTIATKTNDLKYELADRMTVNIVITPNMVKFKDDSINRKIDYYYRIGKNNTVTAMLFEIAANQNGIYCKADVENANLYVTQLKQTYESNDTVITTHKRTLHSDFKHDTIIFDEDPLDLLIDIKQLDLGDLNKLYYEYNDTQLKEIITHLESAVIDEVNETPIWNIDIEGMIENVKYNEIESNIFDFFGSSYFIRDKRYPQIFHYVIKRSLPAKKKIIILSATLPLQIYKMLLGDNIKIINLQDVEQVGQIIQYTKRSCSRHALYTYAKEISELIGDKPVITFKDFGDSFKNPIKEMYFGNCSGYDSIKGQDLVVVGTPHKNNVKYLLTAKVLNIQFDKSDCNMAFQKVTYNGHRFMFNTFSHEQLRDIQLSCIESDLIQAVGRARTLRYNCTVELYSNFPLRISNKFIY